MFHKSDYPIIIKDYVPEGTWDLAGRWYPHDEEKCECCSGLRSPSRDYPKSLWKHCLTKKHIKNKVNKLSYDELMGYKRNIVEFRVRELAPQILVDNKFKNLCQDIIPYYDFEKGITDKFKEVLFTHIVNYLI